MIPVQIKVDANEIKAYIKQQVDEHLQEHLFLVDLEKLMQITSMRETFLDQNILNDPRVKLYQRRKSRKRFWIYKPTIEAIKQIIDAWE